MSDSLQDPDASFPGVPLMLLEELERRFPDKCPDPSTPDRQVWINAGAVSVTRFLRQMFNIQQEST